jgi:hypothetical protein
LDQALFVSENRSAIVSDILEWSDSPISDLSGQIHMMCLLNDLCVLLNVCPES